MVKRVAVGDVMTRNFSHTHPNTNLLDCAKQMVKQRVGCLLLTEDRRLIGLLTQKDILWAMTKKRGKDLEKIRAIDVASKKVAVIKPSADLSQAFHKMREYGFRRLPVIANGELVGILTIKDILKIEPEFYTKTGDLMDVREESRKLQTLENEEQVSEGFCEECGSFADLLRVGPRFLCSDCREELY